MSDIRFNNWKHQSGTGGVYQDSLGQVGIGSTIPNATLDIGGDGYFTGIVTATTFKGAVDASTGAFTSNVTIDGNLGVAGTITYEDVARVDATGISTFREGFGVGPLTGIALTAYKDGSIRSTGIITASSFSGDVAAGDIASGTVPTARLGSGTANNTVFLRGDSSWQVVDSSSIKNGSDVKVQANASGATVTGILTAVGGNSTEGSFISGTAVGVGTTTTTGRNAGVGTATGTLIYNSTSNELQCWHGTQWVAASVQPFTATGGTKNTSSRSGWAVHTFTGPGTFTVSGQSKTGAEYLIVGGGGGGGKGGLGGTGFEVGAGGAGGHRSFSGHTLTPGSYTVVVGAGGPGNGTGDGPPSSVFGQTSAGGGGGAGNSYGSNVGRNGGSGGGGAHPNTAGGNGNTPPVSPSQGNNGGNGGVSTGGGGGGAGAGGQNGINNPNNPGGGSGGNGTANSITGSSVTRAGGGGGGHHHQPYRPPGGSGGGGAGGSTHGTPQAGGPPSSGDPGTANTGGGGGGAGFAGVNGGDGGSGIVIIAYPTS